MSTPEDEHAISLCENELHREFDRVIASDSVARLGYDTARITYKLDEVACLKAAVVALSNANQRLRDKIEDIDRKY